MNMLNQFLNCLMFVLLTLHRHIQHLKLFTGTTEGLGLAQVGLCMMKESVFTSLLCSTIQFH